jgi:hypothetical protein
MYNDLNNVCNIGWCLINLHLAGKKKFKITSYKILFAKWLPTTQICGSW